MRTRRIKISKILLILFYFLTVCGIMNLLEYCRLDGKERRDREYVSNSKGYVGEGKSGEIRCRSV